MRSSAKSETMLFFCIMLASVPGERSRSSETMKRGRYILGKSEPKGQAKTKQKEQKQHKQRKVVKRHISLHQIAMEKLLFKDAAGIARSMTAKPQSLFARHR